ncbi:hypothetical protein GOBAR_AA35274 [Gossypium barbadense]|uniref:Uncharacterized protein n=1 Tax=Gossypium barbadense TaxID=3634 RepID=A0A2P5W2V1_GOSBA|nr:hypothetical protein GOBAR_AA35274 [Gossypium barbadense]
MSVFSPWDLPLPYASNHSNLQCFLRCITPVVPTRLLPKKCNEDSNGGYLETNEKERDEEGYSLSEVWESYREWSAYGVDVPIVLNNGDCVVQYYSPSLSAMQIYTFKPFSSSFSNDSCLSSEAAWDEDSTQTNTMDQCGYLYYQYNEMASPYDRVPLQVKMNELGKHYPGLFDLRSTEISPYSWMAIAWYPVYQIPMATNVKELSACFLTYHPLSGSRTGSNKEEISLPPFAVVTFKLFGTLWINPETSDKDTIICQQTAASNWLRQLQFQHHDFNFFMSRQFQNP